MYLNNNYLSYNKYKYEHFHSQLMKLENLTSHEVYNKKNKLLTLFINEIFDQAKPIPGQGEIVTSAYIMGDGKGDLVHLNCCTKELCKKFPDRKFFIVILSNFAHEGNLSPLSSEQADVIIEYAGRNKTNFSPHTCLQPVFSNETLKRIKKASVFITTPVDIREPGIEKCKLKLKTKSVGISEYDFSVQGFTPDLSAGLSLNGYGVYIKNPKQATLIDLKNPKLKELLFGCSSPTPEDIKIRQEICQLHFCYMHDTDSIAEYIERILNVSRNIDCKTNIDIYCFWKNVKRLKRYIQSSFDENIITDSVSIVDYTSSEIKEELVTYAEKGRKVRLINAGSLSRKDFNLLLQKSSPFVGCTGDHSFITAVCFGKVPFLEALRTHKVNLTRNYGFLIEEKLGADSLLYRYIHEPFPLNFQEIEKISEQAQEISAFVRENYNLKPNLRGYVNWILFCHEYPEIAIKIDQWCMEVKQNERSLAECETLIIQELIHLNLLDAQRV